MADLVIRQFDVFLNPASSLRKQTPFVIVLQSHYVDGIDTQVIAPLHAVATTERLSGLSLVMEIEGETVVMGTSELAHIPATRLRRAVGSLAAHEDDIRRALDRLFTGF